MRLRSVLTCIALAVLPIGSALAAEIVVLPFDRPAYMSADGKWFAEAEIASETTLWSPENGFTNLGTMSGATRTAVSGIAADGAVAVGNGYVQSTTGEIIRQEPFRWTKETGMVGLGLLPGSAITRAHGVSDDGSTVVGYATVAGRSVPWIWTQQSGMTPFTLPPGATGGLLSGVSSDGHVVAGTVSQTTGDRGFVWDAQNGFQLLPPGANNGLASRLSADGSTAAGTISPAPNRLYRWTRDDRMSVIGLPSQFGFVGELTIDGSIMVGYLAAEFGVENFRAFVWDEQHGVQDLRSVLIRDHGFSDAELPVLNDAFQLSADARTLTAHTYVAQNATHYAIYLDKPLVTVVPEPATCVLGAIGAIALAIAARRGRRLNRDTALNFATRVARA